MTIQKIPGRLAFLFYLLILLLVPLPLGSSLPWSLNLMETAITGLAVFVLLSVAIRPDLFNLKLLLTNRSICLLLVLHLVFLGVQIIPLTGGLLELLSPDKAAWFSSEIVEHHRITFSATHTESLNALMTQQAYVLFFCLTLVLVDSYRRLYIVLGLMVAVALFEVIFGVAAYYMGDAFPFWKPQWLGHDWINGTFVNKNHFAAHVSFAISILLGCCMFVLCRKGSGAKPGGNVFSVRTLADTARNILSPGGFYFGLLILLLTGFMMAKSRGALLSLFLAALIVLGLGAYRSGRQSPEAKILPLFIIAAVISAIWLGSSGVLSRIAEQGLTDSSRITAWKQSLILLGDHWVIGIGNGAFEHLFASVRTPGLTSLIYDHLHNDHLQLVLEQGVVGAGLWFLVLYVCSSKILSAFMSRSSVARKRLLSGLMVALLAFMFHGFVDFNFHIPSNALWFYTLLALAVLLSDKIINSQYKHKDKK